MTDEEKMPGPIGPEEQTTTDTVSEEPDVVEKVVRQVEAENPEINEDL